MEIREYQARDLEEILEIFVNTIHKVNIKDYSLEEVNAWTSTVSKEKFHNNLSHSYTLVAVLNKKIVGFINLKDDYLDCLYVHHLHQGEGIASKLLTEVLKVAKFPLTTYASITAKDFFLHKGFKVIKVNQVERSGVILTNYLMELEKVSIN